MSCANFLRFWIVLAVVCVSQPVHAATAAADGAAPSQQHGAAKICCEQSRADDVWLISTRHLGCPCFDKSGGKVDLAVQHRVGKEWTESSLGEFLDTADPQQRTIFYIHGNRVECDEVYARGRQAYHGLLGCSCAEPVRFVIWSWPSGKVRGQLRDFRVKAARTNGEAHYVAWLLGQMDPETPIGLLGYSYGSRVSTGALHVLNGGELAGCTLPVPCQRAGAAIDVVLMAAAVHNHWLRPGGCHERALAQIDRLLIQYNSCDPVLKRYKLIERHRKPQALGYTGMYVDEAIDTWIDQHDVCCIVGRSHAEHRYFCSETIAAEARETLDVE